METNKYLLCEATEVSPGSTAIYDVGGYKVALYNVEGHFFATQNHCQHKGGSLGQGQLNGSVVECPLHGWEFDVISGECLTQTHCRSLRRFPVSIEKNIVWIEDFDKIIEQDAVAVKVSKSSDSDLASLKPDSKQHYDVHVFCCINEREPGHPRGSCSARGSVQLQAYMKARGKELGLGSRIRLNKSGCLERCELGPVMVIYPEGVWYCYNSHKDIDDILDLHILGGKVVERLLLESGQVKPRALTTARIELRVSSKKAYSNDLCQYELVSSNFDLLPPYDPGAHIDLNIGNDFRRSYSLVGDHQDRARYIIGVRREKPSRGGSTWLLDHLEPGHTITSSSPTNNFPLDDQATSYILIAGGIGITPFLSMGYELKRQGLKYYLHFCVRDEESAPLLDEVKNIFGDQLTVYADGGDPAHGINLTSVLENPVKGGHVYVCGPPGLVASVRADASHWPEETVHWEQFSPESEDYSDQNEIFEVLLSRQNMRLTVEKDKTILETVRSVGINIESSCENGLCGCCRTRLLGGIPQHRDSILTDSQKSSSQEVMICVSRAKSGETLVLDL
jgi:phthalate 4,5-dioxygenase reductase subunit